MSDLKDFILFPLESAKQYFEALKYSVTTINNNFNVLGDTLLVTNIKIEDNNCVITYSNFIFNVGE